MGWLPNHTNSGTRYEKEPHKATRKKYDEKRAGCLRPSPTIIIAQMYQFCGWIYGTTNPIGVYFLWQHSYGIERVVSLHELRALIL